MATSHRISTRLIGVVLILAVAQGLCAQEPADPAPAPPPMAPGVAAIMATKPATAPEKVRAAKILAGLDRPDLAKQMLADVLALNLDQNQLFQLEQQFGAPVFVNLSIQPELAPEGKQLADAVLQATKAVFQDTARLDRLAGQLSAKNENDRIAALEGLLQGGRVSIGVLLGVLADPARNAEHEMVRSALAQFGRAAVDPLLAALDGGDTGLKIEAIRTLAGIGARQAVPFFLAPAVAPGTDEELQTIAQRGLVTFGRPIPDAVSASAMLVQDAHDYLNGRKPLREDLDGNVTVWTWDAASSRPVSNSCPVEDARMVYAARLAENAYQLTPADKDVQILFLTCLLEQAAQAAGLENRLPIAVDSPAGTAAAAGLGAVEEVLLYAMEHNRMGAAIAAVRILEERGSPVDQLQARGPKSPLIKAVEHDDPRLRFAAVQAVVGLDPTMPFAGSSAVVDAVCHFATSQGEGRALVAGPSTLQSQQIAGYLAALGYVCDTARSGKELMALALESADYELILVDEGLQQPIVEFLLQQLRHDNRTAQIPVGILARYGRLPQAEHTARRDPLVTAFPRPHSQEVVDWQINHLLALQKSPPLSSEQRLEQAVQAMQWLADWSEGHPVFRLPKRINAVYEALFLPELATQATTILANTGTPDAQKALVELASRWTQPLPRRTAAVEALWTNTEGNGILLTTGEILRQYDRYNASERLDPSSQQVLAAILNCLEAPAKVMQQTGTP